LEVTLYLYSVEQSALHTQQSLRSFHRQNPSLWAPIIPSAETDSRNNSDLLTVPFSCNCVAHIPLCLGAIFRLPSSIVHIPSASHPRSARFFAREAGVILVRCTDSTVEHRWFAHSSASSRTTGIHRSFFFCSPPTKSHPSLSTYPAAN
jgi:hypothetical protein